MTADFRFAHAPVFAALRRTPRAEPSLGSGMAAPGRESQTPAVLRVPCAGVRKTKARRGTGAQAAGRLRGRDNSGSANNYHLSSPVTLNFACCPLTITILHLSDRYCNIDKVNFIIYTAIFKKQSEKSAGKVQQKVPSPRKI